MAEKDTKATFCYTGVFFWKIGSVHHFSPLKMVYILIMKTDQRHRNCIVSHCFQVHL